MQQSYPRACALSALLLLAGCDGASSSPALRLIDLDGRAVDPSQTSSSTVSVFLFTLTDCPISNRYAPEVERLRAKFAPRGVAFWLVYPDPSESPEAIRKHVKEYGSRPSSRANR